MRLAIGIPTMGEPAPRFLESLRDLTLPADCTAIDTYVITGNFPPAQREMLLRRAIRLQADVLVMLDDDMIVPADALVRLTAALAERPRCAVAGGLYYTRDGIRPVAAARWSSGDTTRATIPAFTDGVVDVDGTGFGCVALRVSAAQLLEPPYFSAQIYIEEGLSRVRLANEDFLFCERVRAKGFDVVLDAGVRCRHLDRATDVAYPLEWEAAAETGRERMLVVDPGPRYRLVAADESIARIAERHETVTLDYLFVD